MAPHLSVALLELPTGIPLCPFQLLQPGPQLTGFLLSYHLGLLKQQQLLLLLLLGPLKTEQAVSWLNPGLRASWNSLGAALLCALYATRCPQTTSGGFQVPLAQSLPEP